MIIHKTYSTVQAPRYQHQQCNTSLVLQEELRLEESCVAAQQVAPAEYDLMQTTPAAVLLISEKHHITGY